MSIVAALIVERHGPAIELGGAEEDGDALVPRRSRPGGVRGTGGGDRALDLGGAALLDVGEDVRAAMGHHRLERRPRLDPLAADHHRDVDALAGHLPRAGPAARPAPASPVRSS